MRSLHILAFGMGLATATLIMTLFGGTASRGADKPVSEKPKKAIEVAAPPKKDGNPPSGLASKSGFLPAGPAVTVEPGADELRQLRVERYNAALRGVQARNAEWEAGVSSVDAFYSQIKRLIDAELELFDDPRKQLAVRQKHLEMATIVETRIQQLVNLGARGASQSELASAQFLRLDVEIELLKARREIAKAEQEKAAAEKTKEKVPDNK